jgi:hypothetical protein
LFFVNADKDQTMVDDATMSSSLPITLIQNEELEEALINMNVSQRPHEKEPIKKVLHT